MRLLYLLLVVGFLQFFACSSDAPSTPPIAKASLDGPTENKDEAAVKAAILDYVEGIYEADSTRIERSVHPELRKRGYWFNTKENAYRDNMDMSYEELVHLAATWNQSGTKAAASTVKEIEIYEVKDKTASAKLTAKWGMDYFHLAKVEGRWYIMNVLWQSLPEEQ